MKVYVEIKLYTNHNQPYTEARYLYRIESYSTGTPFYTPFYTMI